MADHYDVIIVGSGAGGGTLAHRLAPSGKRVLILERGDWLPREIENWDADGGLRRQPLRLAGHLVRRRTARPSSRRSTTSSAARRSSTGPRCTGCGSATSASSSTTAASRRPGRSTTTCSSRTTPRPSSSTRCTAPAARTRPSRRPAAPYPFPPVSHEPRIQQLFDDLTAVGLHPFHAPCGIMLDEADAGVQRVHPVRHLRRLPLPGARQVRRRRDRRTAGAGARQRDAGPQRPRAPAARPTRAGRTVTTVVADVDGERAAVQRRRSSWCRPARPTRRSCCSPAPTTRTRTGWPTARTRSGATTCSTTAGRSWPSRPRRTTPGSRRRWGSTTTTSATPTSTTRWATCRWSASPPRRCTAGEKPIETELAPTFALDGRRRARGRLLAVGRGPPGPGQPGHARRRTATSCSATRRTTTSRWSSSTTG